MTVAPTTPLQQTALFWFFFGEGILLGNWAGLIQEVQVDLDISDGVLGDCLFAAAAGALLSMPVVPYLNKVLGSARASLLGSFLLSFVFIVIGISTSVKSIGVLCFGTFSLGFSVILMDASINNQASYYTARDASSIFGRCHGIFSVGILLGALIGAAIISNGQSAQEEFIIISCEIFFSTCLMYPFLITKDEESILSVLLEKDTDASISVPLDEETKDERSGTVDAKKTKADTIAGIGLTPYELWLLTIASVILFIAYFGESAVGDWSGIYIHDNWRASDVVSALGVVAFQASTAIGRLCSDSFLDNTDKRMMIIGCGLLCAGGFAIAVLAYHIRSAAHDLSLAMVFIGYFIAGLGCGPISPATLSIASLSSQGRLVNITAGHMISLVSAMGFLGTVVGPPLMGNVSQGTGGLQWSFLLESACFVLLAMVAWALEDDSQSSRNGDKISLLSSSDRTQSSKQPPNHQRNSPKNGSKKKRNEKPSLWHQILPIAQTTVSSAHNSSSQTRKQKISNGRKWRKLDEDKHFDDDDDESDRL